MKKIAKVGVLGFAFASSLVALLVSATGEFQSQVTLTLTEGNNTCTLSDYMFTTKDASPVDQLTEPLSQTMNCTFLKNNQINVSLYMSDLSGSASLSGVVIPASGFSGYITSGGVLGSIGALEDKILPTLNNQPMIYTKLENTVGEWSGTLTLQGVIPGGTPGGTYMGNIYLMLQVINQEIIN